jgi:hypothetical protein
VHKYLKKSFLAFAPSTAIVTMASQGEDRIESHAEPVEALPQNH